MVPLARFTICFTVANPSPLPILLVVKNGSKIRARVALSIPQPVSATSSRTQVFGVRPLAGLLTGRFAAGTQFLVFREI
jgi:hypothetical protein